jgi:hypothetical protein
MVGNLGDFMLNFYFHLFCSFILFDSNDFIDELTDIIDLILNDIVLELFNALVSIGHFFVIGIGGAFEVEDMPALITLIILLGAGVATGVYGKRRSDSI